VFIEVRGNEAVSISLSKSDGLMEDIGMGIPFRGDQFTVKEITDIEKEAVSFIGDFNEIKAFRLTRRRGLTVSGLQRRGLLRETGEQESLKIPEERIIIILSKERLRDERRLEGMEDILLTTWEGMRELVIFD
jgi:hypothetical protein